VYVKISTISSIGGTDRAGFLWRRSVEEEECGGGEVWRRSVEEECGGGVWRSVEEE
jgi:hypothetical protein